MSLEGQGKQVLEVSRGRLPEAWNAQLLKLKGGYYLSAEYADIQKRDGSEPIYFILREAGEISGMALGFLTRQWMRWPGRQLCREFHWQTHPVVRDDDVARLEAFVDQIVAHVDAIGVLGFHLHSEDARISPRHLDKNAYACRSRLEYSIPLSEDPAEVMARIASRKRTYLRSAIKSSLLEVREEATLEAVSKLIDFQEVSRDRRRKRGEDYAISAPSAAKRIFEDYIQSGQGKLFLSYQEGVPLSGILLHCWGGRAYYTMSGCSEAGFSANAPLLTVWCAIQALCRQGYVELNMGGVGASGADPADVSHGLYRFKRSFGGNEIECYTYERRSTGLRAQLGELLLKR